jgi:hypothetical protein
MRKAGCRCTWLVAAALGLAGPALAQTPPSEVAADDAPGRAETRIKLAWLADPLTFRQLLAVHPRGTSLEIEGFVPSEEVRRRALQLAWAQTRMHVIDSLQVRSGMIARLVLPQPVEVLAQAAGAILHEAFGERAADFRVVVRPDGRVTLLGWVESDEERLAVSQRLCRLEGCTSIDNELRVPGGATSAPAVTLAPPVRQEPRPLPRSILRAETPTVPAPRPQPRAVPVRPIVRASTTTPATLQAPAPPPGPPMTLSELPLVVAGSAKKPLDLGRQPRGPDIVCPPIELPEIKHGAGAPMRSTLDLSPAPGAPARWYEPGDQPPPPAAVLHPAEPPSVSAAPAAGPR